VNPKSFFAELKRRNVYKVAIAYAIVAWLLLQAASILFPTFEAPPWTMKVFVAVIALGFPIALVLAWAFELTPEGIKRAEDVDVNKSITRKTGRKLDFFIIAVLRLVIGILLFQRLHPNVSPAVSSSLEKSIAVLPFENLSRDPDNAYFAEGVQEEILTRLAKIADLKVISRTSTQRYQSKPGNLSEIAKQLGVANILEGSVQKAGDSVRVTVNLIQAASDSHLWADTYDRKLTDIFKVESDIAKTIADTLQVKLSGSEKTAIAKAPTANRQRYVQAYCLAVVNLGLGDHNEAINWLEEGYRERDGFGMGIIRIDPLLDPLRGDPRFEALAAKVFSTQKPNTPLP
jgi:TolB-like protein